MKITGWIVANTSSWGFRRMFMRLRQAITIASPTTRGRRDLRRERGGGAG